mmetsp:Transcript_12006/g.35654  ORF Transcript_12006/g.35654 Transcript_12006/m.35654 type:complete len:240 (-) Transcript_12006:349-1068(-)
MLSKWRPSCSVFNSASSRLEASNCCSKWSRSCPVRSHSVRSRTASFSSKRHESSKRCNSSLRPLVSPRSVNTSCFSASIKPSRCSMGCASPRNPPKKAPLLSPRSKWRPPKSGLFPSLAWSAPPPPKPKPGDPDGESCGACLRPPLSFFDFGKVGWSSPPKPKPPSPPKSAGAPQPDASGDFAGSSVGPKLAPDAAGPKSVHEPAGETPRPPGAGDCESNKDRADDVDSARGEREACAA